MGRRAGGQEGGRAGGQDDRRAEGRESRAGGREDAMTRYYPLNCVASCTTRSWDHSSITIAVGTIAI